VLLVPEPSAASLFGAAVLTFLVLTGPTRRPMRLPSSSRTDRGR
jgi:hypothetical protein